MKILFIDGIQRGRVETWKDAPPTFRIHQPKKISPHEIDMPWEDHVEYIEYKRTFIGEDGKTAIYSQTGKSIEALEDMRTWVVKPLLGELEPIYFNKS